MEYNAEYQLLKDLDSSALTPPGLKIFTEHNHEQKLRWMEKNWSLSIYVVSAYLIFIYAGQKYMKNRKPLDLTNVMVIWNFALAAFSIYGGYIMIPELLANFNWHDSVCLPWKARSLTARHWGWLFTASKIPELIDTVFIVLRKKSLIFLHWYHHISVLLYCWYTYTEQNSTAVWFSAMNFAVHSFMYSYFALRAIQIKIPSKISIMITSLQILQMIVGLFVVFYAYAMKLNKTDCNSTPNSLYLALTMYSSYFVLFANFFYKTYFVRGKNRKEKKVL